MEKNDAIHLDHFDSPSTTAVLISRDGQQTALFQWSGYLFLQVQKSGTGAGAFIIEELPPEGAYSTSKRLLMYVVLW